MTSVSNYVFRLIVTSRQSSGPPGAATQDGISAIFYWGLDVGERMVREESFPALGLAQHFPVIPLHIMVVVAQSISIPASRQSFTTVHLLPSNTDIGKAPNRVGG